jgi:putative Ca2+/H+ antiporter (TMEM165/GDT1 family)
VDRLDTGQGAGRRFGDRRGTTAASALPEKPLHVAASLLFLTFGLWMLFDSALGRRWVAVSVAMTVAAIAVAQTRRGRRTVTAIPRRTTANRLS